MASEEKKENNKLNVMSDDPNLKMGLVPPKQPANNIVEKPVENKPVENQPTQEKQSEE